MQTDGTYGGGASVPPPSTSTTTQPVPVPRHSMPNTGFPASDFAGGGIMLLLIGAALAMARVRRRIRQANEG